MLRGVNGGLRLRSLHLKAADFDSVLGLVTGKNLCGLCQITLPFDDSVE